MGKIHLQRNKAENGQTPIAMCATRPEVPVSKNGRIARNSRLSYQFMASEIVKVSEFRATALEDRCAHCMTAGLTALNRQRDAAGKAPLGAFK